MKQIRTLLERRLVIAILLPLILAGIVAGLVCLKLLTRPLSDMLGQKAASDLIHAADMSLSICEERFDDLLSLRMENNPKVNNSIRRQALEEIKQISKNFVNIEIMVIRNGRIVCCSVPLQADTPGLDQLAGRHPSVFRARIGGHQIMASVRYFPFWRWQIVSFIFDTDFQAPITLAQQILAVGISGVILIMMGVVYFLFQKRIYRPLQHLTTGARNIAQGHFEKVAIVSRDEIGQVAEAFNAMVKALMDDKQMISRMMSELRDSEERYRVLTEHALAHIAVIQDSRIVYANSKVLEDLGYTRQSPAEVPAANFVHPEDRPWVVETINSIFKGERNGAHFECRYLDKSGRSLWFENLATAIVYREKPAVVIHAINIEKRKREETKRKELEHRLSRVQKMEAIGALAGSVAHDLNNILGGLVTYPELLLLDLDKDSSLYQPLVMIQQAGQRAASIVQDLLTLARRGIQLSEVLNLNETIKNYVSSPEFSRLQAEYPQVRLELNLDADLDNIIGSSVHLSKTVMNLVANAFEASENGGVVVVTTCRQELSEPLEVFENIKPGKYAVLTVEDMGVGIASEDIQKIFEPFFTKKIMGRSGTGLGMAVVWSTVKDHDGFIDVTSEPGKGTRFALYFPVTERPQKDASPATDLDPLKGNETILLVDDIHDQRMLGRHLLEKLGYTVMEAACGEEAVAMIKERPFDLVVLDMIMDPGIDGLETFRRILDINPRQKAIIASGYSETIRVKKALALGAGSYIRKPYTIVSLGEAVRRCLDDRGPDRQS